MKILITGSSGQLGSELRDLSLEHPQHEYFFADRRNMPLDDIKGVYSLLEEVNPDLIINAGAYTAVDRAESEPEIADVINHFAVDAMAKWANRRAKKLIQISTDYVFQGDSSTPLGEDELTDPINVYGKSKEAAEKAILSSKVDAVIIRTAWVYSTYGNNFVKTMLRLMYDKDEISVIEDQVGSPTYAGDLAQAIFEIVNYPDWQSGIYHYSNEGETSWYEFAQIIRDLKGLVCEINPISSDEYPTAAKRPKYSLLDKSKIKDIYGVPVPDWTESLQKMLNKL